MWQHAREETEQLEDGLDTGVDCRNFLCQRIRQANLV
jgi:hypothetical protein